MNEAQYVQLPSLAGKDELYQHLMQSLQALLGNETNLIANSANAASLLYHTLSDVNWCGFYFLDGEELVLGPFQGKPACVRIPLGKGVCGTAAEQRETFIIPDVERFPGHIACDAASRSELVVPMIFDDRLIGVLDIDSPSVGRFDEHDAQYCERIVHTILFASAELFNKETE